SDVTVRGNWIALPARDESKPLPAFQGEPLRARTNPSVSQLLEKRALSLSEPGEGNRGFDTQRGAVFALRLYVWDPRNPRTLPTLQTAMRRCVEFQNEQRKGDGYSEQGQIGGRIARLAIARVALGDAKAADEYATWLRSVNPAYLGHETQSSLYALMHDPGNPVWERVATSLFGTDSSPWGRVFADPEDRSGYHTTELLRGAMIRVTAFRELVQKRLTDQTPAGTVSRYPDDPTSVSYKWLDGVSMGPTPTRREKPRTGSVRVCDRVALGLQGLPGVPIWEPFASEGERDRQCAAIAGYLRKYGSGFRESNRYERPLYGFDMGSPFDVITLGFGTGKTPATERDVAQNKAVFALGAENRPRVVPDLPLPLDASWEKDPFAQVSKNPDGKTRRYSRGKIYQAEEEWDGKRWRRYYGFVGTHTIAKVAADEITITDFRYTVRNAGTPVPKREP
ncbi:MAG: hypothetical protein H7145_16770, partial [Akkermansiaceae bacterium]|nr:hypothetical protein [Armatimonadota bacterium]